MLPHTHTLMNKMNNLGCLIGLSLVSLEMQMSSVKGDDHILVLDHILSCSLALQHSCCSTAAQSDQCVCVERRQGETAQLSALNKRWRKGKYNKGGVSFMHCGGQDLRDPSGSQPVGPSLILQVLRWLQIRSQQHSDVLLTNVSPLLCASTHRLVLFLRRLLFPTSCWISAWSVHASCWNMLYASCCVSGEPVEFCTLG